MCIRLIHIVPVALTLIIGCATHPPTVQTKQNSTEGQAQMVALLKPAKIEIIKPFTRAKSFDNDPEPDGIELLIQAVNSLDVPGRMMVGRLNVALYEYIPASADRRGKQLDRWEIDLSSAEQQKTYWSRLTHMYEIRLTLDRSQVPPAAKYVLQVTYNSPLGEHLSDQCVIDFLQTTGTIPNRS